MTNRVMGESWELFDAATGRHVGVSDQRGNEQLTVNLAVRTVDANTTVLPGDSDGLVVLPSTAAAARTWTLAPVGSAAGQQLYDLGQITTFVNDSATYSVTLAGGSGVRLTSLGDGKNGNFTIAPKGGCTAVMIATDVWMVSGKGATN